MATIQSEINELVRRINKVSTNAKKESQAAFRMAAKPIIAAIQAKAPVSDEPHSRYIGGRKVATYYPGNLKRSFKTLTFRRSAAIFIGPKLDKAGSKGDFKGNRTDGYYAHFVEFGTIDQPPKPFVRPAAAQAGPPALRMAANELRRAIIKHAQQYQVK